MSERMPKINELIKQYVSVSIQRTFMDEIISVTKVEVSRDLSYAKIWIAAFADPDGAVKRCQSCAREFQKDLAGNLEIRKTPKLHFVADRTGENVDLIEKLIKEIKKEK